MLTDGESGTPQAYLFAGSLLGVWAAPTLRRTGELGHGMRASEIRRSRIEPKNNDRETILGRRPGPCPDTVPGRSERSQVTPWVTLPLTTVRKSRMSIDCHPAWHRGMTCSRAGEFDGCRLYAKVAGLSVNRLMRWSGAE